MPSTRARFSQIFSNDSEIFAPKVYWDFTHPHILVMEYMDGIPLDQIDRLLAANVDLKKTAERLLGAFLKQIFEFGFYQADPHPGNFLVLPDNRIAFIDFGSSDSNHALYKSLESMLSPLFEG
jgi:ubiquinone biosynthesis protein